MNQQVLLEQTMVYVQEKMQGESTGHDWFHVQRVYNLATKIAQKIKKSDVFLVGMAALLHDIGDWKVNKINQTEEMVLRQTMNHLSVSLPVQEEILSIILNMSYSSNLDGTKELSLEGKIVQDADRLEALGAIGIARAFAYGGKHGRELYNPAIQPQIFSSTDAYRTAKGTTVNHFYEKLFLLKDRLNTKAAKQIATKREKFMKEFLEAFYNEWEGK